MLIAQMAEVWAEDREGQPIPAKLLQVYSGGVHSQEASRAISHRGGCAGDHL